MSGHPTPSPLPRLRGGLRPHGASLDKWPSGGGPSLTITLPHIAVPGRGEARPVLGDQPSAGPSVTS